MDITQGQVIRIDRCCCVRSESYVGAHFVDVVEEGYLVRLELNGQSHQGFIPLAMYLSRFGWAIPHAQLHHVMMKSLLLLLKLLDELEDIHRRLTYGQVQGVMPPFNMVSGARSEIHIMVPQGTWEHRFILQPGVDKVLFEALKEVVRWMVGCDSFSVDFRPGFINR